MITFAESALKAAVQDALGLPTSSIRYVDAYQMSALEADWRGIADLTGIECLEGLTYLYLPENSISDLGPLVELTSLTYLYLHRNSISNLSPLAELTSLTWLTLNGNSITDLTPLAGLTALTELVLSYNNVSDLGPLVANTGLGSGDYVSLYGNPIDCTEQAENIQTLEDRGVNLSVDCS